MSIPGTQAPSTVPLGSMVPDTVHTAAEAAAEAVMLLRTLVVLSTILSSINECKCS